MIIVQKDIYKEIADDNGIDEEIVASVGNIVFQSLRHSLNNPTHLAYELPKIGTFNIRFNRFEKNYYSFVDSVSLEKNEGVLKKYEDEPEIFAQHSEIISKIEDFRNKRKETKKRRNETEQTSKN